MADFIASCYQIKRHGKHVTDGVFTAAEEIFEHIRCQRAGVYQVYRRVDPGPGSRPGTAFWGEVAHFGAGKISFDPSPALL